MAGKVLAFEGGGPMRVRIQVIIESETIETPVVQEVATLQRGPLQPEGLGLTLAEAKDLLRGVQETMAAGQVAEFVTQQERCSGCGQVRPRKGRHEIVYRTLFGKLRLDSPRLYACSCQDAAPRASTSPLAERLPERTAPELAYLEAKFAALMSYGLTVELLTEILPLGAELNTTAVRRQVRAVAERADGELGAERPHFIEGCQRDRDQLPRPDPPLTAGLDGGYVHARHPSSRTERCFEVIAGKVLKPEGASKCFAFVPHVETRPKRRLFEVLKAQGLQANQRVEFLTDGGDTVRELPRDLSPESEHWLDWFHVTMRLTVLGQMTRGSAAEQAPGPAPGDAGQEQQEGAEPEKPPDGAEPEKPPDGVEPESPLERLKWHLWHGNAYRALQIIADLEGDLEARDEGSERAKKLLKAVREFRHYIEVNRSSIPNYGDRYRHGEAISTSFVESTVNQVISKRMVKKQQMRWTEAGAHRLLQVRTQVLNDDLRATFDRWYPGLKAAPEPAEEVAA
jgi:hypothetical protein